MSGPVIRAVSAFHADAQVLRDALSKALEDIVGDPGRNSFADWKDGDPDHYFVVAYCADLPIGCGGLRRLEPGIGEIKRMYAKPGNVGTGSALLAHLEQVARQRGFERVRMETRKVNSRAIAFYNRHGYRTIAPYGRYVGCDDAVCFEKSLTESG